MQRLGGEGIQGQVTSRLRGKARLSLAVVLGAGERPETLERSSRILMKGDSDSSQPWERDPRAQVWEAERANGGCPQGLS